MEFDITAIIEIIIGIISAVCARYLVPWLKAKVRSETWSFVLSLIDTLVTSAEETITEPKSGESKFAYVKDALEKRLSALHITVDWDDAYDAIQAAVKKLRDNESKTTE